MVEHKKGATFYKSFAWLNYDGTPIDLTGYVLSSQARLPDDTLIQTFTIIIDDYTGGITVPYHHGYIYASKEDCEKWPVARLSFDMEAVLEGIKQTSDTAYIRVKQDETHD